MEKWQELATAYGWVECFDGKQDVLLHEELCREWPAGDWEGACRDIGLDEEDLAKMAGA